jgi:starch synthase (maltosyl-transferring)
MKRSRVVIENVIPEINDGQYYVKRTQGGGVVVSADIFADGFDSIRAFVLYKHETDKSWHDLEMELEANGRWSARFVTEKRGFYHYKIEAWVDRLKSWYEKFLRKYQNGEALQLEVLVGAQILEQTAGNYKKKDAEILKNAANSLSDTNDFDQTLEYVLSEEFKALIDTYPYKLFPTVYDKNFRARVGSQKGLFSTWYQLFPRSTGKDGKHGTFKDVEKLLPRIQQLGFDVLYFPPIHPIGKTNRKGKNNALEAGKNDPGSPWAIGSKEGGHKEIHPELGTMKDFENLVKAAEKHEIDIAFDLAFQCSPDHPWVKEHPQWFRWRPDGSIGFAENPPYVYQDVVPFDFETDDWENLWTALLDIVLFWIDKGIQIFRVAVPHTKPLPFWEWLISEVTQRHPDVIFLSAAFASEKMMSALSKVGFTQSYTYFMWKDSRELVENYMRELTGPELRQYFRPSFWPNVPDVLPYHLMNGESNIFAQRLLLAATLSSSYGVYGPAFEFMENKGLPNGRDEYLNSEKFEIKTWDWDLQNRLTVLMAKINKIRKENSALQSTFNLQFTNSDNDELLSFVKSNDDRTNIIWCIASFDMVHVQSGFVQVPKDILGIQRRVNIRVHDLLTGETYNWFNDWNYVELNPSRYPMHIFKVDVIDQPSVEL